MDSEDCCEEHAVREESVVICELANKSHFEEFPDWKDEASHCKRTHPLFNHFPVFAKTLLEICVLSVLHLMFD